MEILGHSDCFHIYGRVKQQGVKEHEHQELCFLPSFVIIGKLFQFLRV